ncbi:UDP-glucosyltransferase 2, partial [Leptinotarsa decemlineata]|uniref:UDP-glucosyltransferase 2 n=1 Tax=Leptinotarsa decemlineata TaxID=7539 RepID=UPI003D30AACB
RPCYASGKRISLSEILWDQNLLQTLVEAQLGSEEVQKLIKDPEEHFDLVIVEEVWPLIHAFGARFKSPVISISSFSPFLHSHDNMGNPTHPVYPDTMMTFGNDYSITYRLKGFLYNLWLRGLFYWYIMPKEDKLARKYFGNDIPYLGEVYKNTSLFLVNVNPIMGIPRANVPNVIEINQVHIQEKKPLPKDLQEFLDSSENGAIYFSLGSSVNSSNLDSRITNTLSQAFSELPYNVLWKREIDDLANKPDNVLIRKWLPQQDILGHPKVKVFVTQGGLQSIEEAIYNEVPMVGIPLIVDQPLNIEIISDKGIAVGLNSETMTKDDVKKAIIEVAENERYKEKVREAAAILKDQPLKGVDKAIYWIEYILRHKGAKHLRSPAADMPFYEYFMLDVIVVLIVICLSCVFLVTGLYGLIRNMKRKNKIKKN